MRHPLLSLLALLTVTAWLPQVFVCGQSSERIAGLIQETRQAKNQFRRIDTTLQHQWSSPADFDVRLVGAASEPTEMAWRGALEIKSPGSYRLHVHGRGSIKLLLRGEQVVWLQSNDSKWAASEEINLSFGYHPFEVQYQPLQDGSGQFGVYWQGPGFDLEPISYRYLSHQSSNSPGDLIERGKHLAHALRCASCHTGALMPEPIPAAALTRLAGNLERSWVENWLRSVSSESAIVDEELRDDELSRRMPHFGMSAEDAADIAEALWTASEELTRTEPPRPKNRASAGNPNKTAGNKSKEKPRTTPDSAQGKIVFNTRGCIACHDLREQGIGLRNEDSDDTFQIKARFDHLLTQLFGGGDLSGVGLKRPGHFFARWLTEPERINASHRMPLPQLTELERDDLALYLSSLKSSSKASSQASSPSSGDTAVATNPNRRSGDAERGKQLIAAHRCAACHQLPAQLQTVAAVKRTRIEAGSAWQGGCLGQPDPKRHIPGFGLTSGQRRALTEYWKSYATESQPTNVPTDSELLIAQRGCLACHARGDSQGIALRATAMVAIERDLAQRLPALLPPSITGVGDKLHDAALRAAIERKEEPRRPWLDVQMPKYQLSTEELDRLAKHLIAKDRIPDRDESNATPLADDVVTRSAAGRLVTSEGFGCQSCHQIGKQPSPTVALGARGTNLTMLGDRIRHSWFDRWVRNPVRIVPRMEMPAIQLPVHGVLGNDLNRQIDAVWEMLNTPGFQPPTPAPVRVVRGHNLPDQHEAAQVLTDVLETSNRNFLRPLIVGFENRHNLLFDLERGDFARWWIGDTARELTRGKSWYWELGGQPLAATSDSFVSLSLVDASGQVWSALPKEQFAVEFDQLEHTTSGIVWRGRMHFAAESQRQLIPISMKMEPLPTRGARNSESVALATLSGMVTTLELELRSGFQLALDFDALATRPPSTPGASVDRAWTVEIDPQSRVLVRGNGSELVAKGQRRVLVSANATTRKASCSLQFETGWPVDQVAKTSTSQGGLSAGNANESQKSLPAEPASIALKVVPGFDAIRLPLPRDEMPTALSWYKNQLVVGSLKGRVCLARDTNSDGVPDAWLPISDDLPAPYGLAVSDEGIDVLAKFGLVRLTPPAIDGVPWNMQVVADGWGHTADYHDWAVGLPRDPEGNYFVALPCQQDDRSPSAARLRGSIQKLIPQTPTSDNPRRYRLETLAAGQRFPMGLAFDRAGNLFATDNQGNYNPFNEVNHIQAGKRYGFINKLENKPGFNPPLESPAVNLPHPWTRSVNGICFLNTPSTAKQPDRFGPFEGHMIGCEYNYLSLIRMTFEEVDGVIQGAAYAFSRQPESGEATFEGPVVCQVDPQGDLIVGNIHDSGWGGGQNTGSIVRVSPSGQWANGIRTVTARPTGLAIEFVGQVQPALAESPTNYSVRSYRRVSTPAYGGNDQEERQEKILAARLLPGSSRVELELNDLRADCVYEVRVGDVAGPNAALFPNEAHYTMKRLPK